MELHIIDRIAIPSILPAENSFMDYNLKRAITQKVGITQDDIEKYEIREDAENKRTVWNAKADQETPLWVEFTAQELDYLRKACEKMSDTTAPDHMWNTVEKIYQAVQEHA